MHGAAGAVADELAHRQRLVHQALAGERRVAVHQDAHHRAPRAWCRRPCPGARAPCRPPPDRPLPDATGLGCSDRCTCCPSISTSVEVPRWYFTSPEPCTSSGLKLAPPNSLNSAANGFFTMLTSVLSRPRCGMPMAISLHARRGGGCDDGVQRRDGDLAALQPEALGADVARWQNASKPFGLGQVLQDCALARGVEMRAPGRALDAALDPGLLVGVLDVHELDADRAAIGVAQHLRRSARTVAVSQAQHVVDEDRPVHVGLGEAVGARDRAPGCGCGTCRPSGSSLRLQMAAHAIGADQHQRAQAVLGGGAHLLGRAAPRRRLAARRRAGAARSSIARARRPGGAGGVGQDGAGFVVQRSRTGRRSDGSTERGVGDPARIQLGDEGRIRAAEGGGEDVDAGHVGSLTRGWFRADAGAARFHIWRSAPARRCGSCQRLHCVAWRACRSAAHRLDHGAAQRRRAVGDVDAGRAHRLHLRRGGVARRREMTAPAWPMRRPGGAVAPAMKPTDRLLHLVRAPGTRPPRSRSARRSRRS